MVEEKYADRLTTWPSYSCGEGWWPLINDTIDQILALDPECSLHQVKEKFGGLRLYVSPSGDFNSDAIRNLVDEAERKAFDICELCGSTDSVDYTNTYWIRRLCKDCRDGKTEAGTWTGY